MSRTRWQFRYLIHEGAKAVLNCLLQQKREIPRLLKLHDFSIFITAVDRAELPPVLLVYLFIYFGNKVSCNPG